LAASSAWHSVGWCANARTTSRACRPPRVQLRPVFASWYGPPGQSRRGRDCEVPNALFSTFPAWAKRPLCQLHDAPIGQRPGREHSTQSHVDTAVGTGQGRSQSRNPPPPPPPPPPARRYRWRPLAPGPLSGRPYPCFIPGCGLVHLSPPSASCGWRCALPRSCHTRQPSAPLSMLRFNPVPASSTAPVRPAEGPPANARDRPAVAAISDDVERDPPQSLSGLARRGLPLVPCRPHPEASCRLFEAAATLACQARRRAAQVCLLMLRRPLAASRGGTMFLTGPGFV